MGLLDAGEEPKAKTLRYAVTGVAFVILMSFGIWYFALRFHGETSTVQHFMDAVAAGNFRQAYQIWKPHPSYSFGDFMADWGLEGYYGPIKSYHIESAELPRNGGSGVIVSVEISPFQPFPADNDPHSGRDREVRLWVERSDLSLSFPP